MDNQIKYSRLVLVSCSSLTWDHSWIIYKTWKFLINWFHHRSPRTWLQFTCKCNIAVCNTFTSWSDSANKKYTKSDHCTKKFSNSFDGHTENTIFSNASIINPNSLAPFFVSSLSPRKGRGQKMGVPPGFRTGDPPHHNALFTHGTPPGCRCPGSDFVPIWDPLLWRNRT